MSTRQAGFGIIEVMVALSVMTVGLMGLLAAFLGSMRLTEQSQEHYVLSIGIRNAIEILRSAPFATAATEFSAGSGKDVFWCTRDGAVTFFDPGDAFARGRIEVFPDETVIAPFLSKQAAKWLAQEHIPPAFFNGQGLDLNLDGIQSGAFRRGTSFFPFASVSRWRIPRALPST